MKIFQVFATISLVCFCNKPTETDICEPVTDTVSWEECIQILNSGCVEAIAQAHSLDDYLILKNKREIKTKEPSIDLIFVEVDKCGDNCKDISMATE